MINIMRGLSRRTALVGGVGGLLAAGAGVFGAVEENALPGKFRLDRAIGRCGGDPPRPRAKAVVRQDAFWSRRRGRQVTTLTVLPPGVPERGLPVCVVMHGFSGDARGVLGHWLDGFLAQVTAAGTPPYALASVDGGNGYWHGHANGDDPLAMITDELLPRLNQSGLRTDRIGILGWSMGGYGALLAAETLGPSRVAAIAATSPAVFPTYPAARRVNQGAFDDQADFDRHDVLRGLDRLKGVATWLDCGTSDPFAGVVSSMRRRLGAPAGGMFGGCHDGSYWHRRAPAQLQFLGRHL